MLFCITFYNIFSLTWILIFETLLGPVFCSATLKVSLTQNNRGVWGEPCEAFWKFKNFTSLGLNVVELRICKFYAVGVLLFITFEIQDLVVKLLITSLKSCVGTSFRCNKIYKNFTNKKSPLFTFLWIQHLAAASIFWKVKKWFASTILFLTLSSK